MHPFLRMISIAIAPPAAAAPPFPSLLLSAFSLSSPPRQKRLHATFMTLSAPQSKSPSSPPLSPPHPSSSPSDNHGIGNKKDKKDEHYSTDEKANVKAVVPVEDGVASENAVEDVGDAPEKPLPGDCCGSGCVRCVWDVYYEELEVYNAKKAAALERARKPS